MANQLEDKPGHVQDDNWHPGEIPGIDSSRTADDSDLPEGHPDNLEGAYKAPSSESPDALKGAEESAASGASDVGAASEADKLGKGYSGDTSDDNSATGRGSGLKKKFRMTKQKSFAGIAVSILIGSSFMGLGVLQGPMELVHLSKILQKNSFGEEKTTAHRTRGLFRYFRTKDVGETRVSWRGSRTFTKTMAQLKDAGIEVDRNELTGHLKSMTFDPSKNSEFGDLGTKEAKTEIARRLGISEDRITIDKNVFRIDISDFGITEVRELTKNSLGLLDDGKIITGMKFRVLAKFFNIPSLFHPLERAKAKTENKVATAIEARKAEEERANARQPEETSKFKAAKDNLKAKLKGNEGKFQAALLVTSAMCIVREVSDDVVTVNRAEIVAPTVVQATDKIAIGAQIQSGNDLTAAEAGQVVKSLRDSSGNSIWKGKALQATADPNNANGEDISADYQQAFSDNSSAKSIRETLGGGSVGAVACSPLGQIIQAAGGVVLAASGFFDGGASWAVIAAKQTAGVAATAGAFYVIKKHVTEMLTDKAIVPAVLSGAKGGNLLAYGAREAANIVARASGGIKFTATQAAMLDQEQELQNQKEFRSKSYFARMFDTSDYRSLASKAIDSVGDSPTQQAHDFASSILNVSKFASAIFSPLSTTAHADTSYRWGFSRYGIPDSIANAKKYANPYDNADVVAGLLDSDTGDYKNRAEKCFGVKIEKGVDGWGVTPDGEVNPNSSDYTDGNCGDVSDENWQRMMLFVFDTRTMDTIACFQGDDSACTDAGVSTGATTGSSSSDSGSSSDVPVDANLTIKKLSPFLKVPYPGRKITPKGITLHWWGSNGSGGIDSLATALAGNTTCTGGGCSVQFGITKEGDVYQMTKDPLDYTEHATGGNSTTIGIEIEGGPSDFGKDGITKYPKKFASTVALVKYLVNTYHIPIDGQVICGNVTGIHPHKAYNSCTQNAKEDIDDDYFNEVIKQVKA